MDLKYKGVDYPVDGCDCFCCGAARGEMGGLGPELLGPAEEDKDGIIEALRKNAEDTWPKIDDGSINEK